MRASGSERRAKGQLLKADPCNSKAAGESGWEGIGAALGADNCLPIRAMPM